MSPLVETVEQRRGWYQHPAVVAFVLPFVVPAVMGLASVWMAQARTADRIAAVETRQQTADQRVDAEGREREKQLDELRKAVVTKELLDAKWKAVEKIERTTDQLLQLQLDERRRR